MAYACKWHGQWWVMARTIAIGMRCTCQMAWVVHVHDKWQLFVKKNIVSYLSVENIKGEEVIAV